MTDLATQRILTQYLADKDTPCPRCGYNLRNLTASRCPECGLKLNLKIELVGTESDSRIFFKWWLFTLLWTIAVGILSSWPTGVALFAIFNDSMRYALNDPSPLLYIVFMLPLPASLSAATLLIAKRRAFIAGNSQAIMMASLLIAPAFITLFGILGALGLLD